MFAILARESAAALGVPHLAVATVPHPLGGLDARLMNAKALALRLLDALTAPAARQSDGRDIAVAVGA